MAYDGASGQVRTVTDLRGDGSDGWAINGSGISVDCTRIAISSLYGATQADVDTMLPTQHIWTFASDGSDFRRLTPVFPNTGGGRNQFAIEVRNPSFSRTGADVLYGYGEYWYEGTTLKGGSGIWSVGAAGGKLPALFAAPSPCSLVDPSVDPKSGRVAVIHNVCAGPGDGIYLYAEDGSGAPESDWVGIVIEGTPDSRDKIAFAKIAYAGGASQLSSFDCPEALNPSFSNEGAPSSSSAAGRRAPS